MIDSTASSSPRVTRGDRRRFTLRMTLDPLTTLAVAVAFLATAVPPALHPSVLEAWSLKACLFAVIIWLAMRKCPGCGERLIGNDRPRRRRRDREPGKD